MPNEIEVPRIEIPLDNNNDSPENYLGLGNVPSPIPSPTVSPKSNK